MLTQEKGTKKDQINQRISVMASKPPSARKSGLTMKEYEKSVYATTDGVGISRKSLARIREVSSSFESLSVN